VIMALGKRPRPGALLAKKDRGYRLGTQRTRAFLRKKAGRPRTGPRNTKESPKTRAAEARQRAPWVGGGPQGGTVVVVRQRGASVSIGSEDHLTTTHSLVSADALELIAQTRNA
jgi:hypothetical protein